MVDRSASARRPGATPSGRRRSSSASSRLWVTGGVMAWYDYRQRRSSTCILFVRRRAGWCRCRLHEYAHALFAYRAGDRGVAEPRLPDPEPAQVHPSGAVDRAAGAVPAARRHRPARRRGLGRPARDPAAGWRRRLISLVGPRCQPGLPDRCCAIPFVVGVGHRRAPDVLGRAGVPGLPAAHRGGAEPAADARPGRRQRAAAVAAGRLRREVFDTSRRTGC